MVLDWRKTMLSAAGFSALTAAVIAPVAANAMSETDPFQALFAVDVTPAQPVAEPAATSDTGSSFADSAQPVVDAASGKLDPEIVCMAKVVHHEARNQPRKGQLAVAQIIVNRMRSGRFASTACGVANQRGQFFDTAGYAPDRASGAWATAVAVAAEALAGTSDDVVKGAYFFRSALQPSSRFFRGRTMLASVGDHVFYR